MNTHGPLSQSLQAIITNYQRQKTYNNRNLFFHDSGGWAAKIKTLAGLLSGEDLCSSLSVDLYGDLLRCLCGRQQRINRPRSEISPFLISPMRPVFLWPDHYPKAPPLNLEGLDFSTATLKGQNH